MKKFLKFIPIALFGFFISSCESTHTHTYNDGVVSKNPTCEADGVVTYLCTGCGDIKEVVMAKVDHTPSDWIVILEPTCENKGSKHKICSSCSKELESQSIDPVGHKILETITIEATCLSEGKKHFSCENCDYSYDETIKALGHQYANLTVVDPTCLNSGYSYETCIRCNDVKKSNITDPLGHDLHDVITLEPTCVDEGIKHQECSRCDYVSEDEKVEANGHSIRFSEIAATCTEKTKVIATCVVCNENWVSREYDEPLGHDLHDVITLEPTCVDEGIKHQECSRCDYVGEDEKIEATGHDIRFSEVAATCTEKTKVIATCVVCNEKWVSREYGEPLGHDYIFYSQEASCYNIGEEYDKCSICNDIINYVKTGEQLTHDFVEKKEEKTINSKEKRTVYTYICSHCELSYLSKIEFTYDNSSKTRVGANSAYSYFVDLNFSDVSSYIPPTFYLKWDLDFSKTGDLVCHFMITNSGSEVDGGVSVAYSVSAISNAFASYDMDKAGSYYNRDDQTTFASSKISSNHMIYFFFSNQNYFNAMTINSLSATIVFEFEVPAEITK